MSSESQDTLNSDDVNQQDDNVQSSPVDQYDEAVIDESDEPVGEQVASELQTLNDEVASLKEQVLRAQAEAQNARRRAEQDVEKARKFALEKFVSELLVVADNLERAITSGDPDDDAQKSVLEGVTLTHKSLVDTLKKFQVEAIDPEGEPFDPQLHQAMSMVPSPDVDSNTVLNVFQKGYTLYGRLVRPAMVVVSSAPVQE